MSEISGHSIPLGIIIFSRRGRELGELTEEKRKTNKILNEKIKSLEEENKKLRELISRIKVITLNNSDR